MPGGWGTPTWQGGDVAVGEVFVSEKTTEMAGALLAAAESLGLEALVVRTVRNGFIVPEAVWDAAQTARADREGWDF
jgi:hypothetical protein